MIDIKRRLSRCAQVRTSARCRAVEVEMFQWQHRVKLPSDVKQWLDVCGDVSTPAVILHGLDPEGHLMQLSPHWSGAIEVASDGCGNAYAVLGSSLVGSPVVFIDAISGTDDAYVCASTFRSFLEIVAIVCEENRRSLPADRDFYQRHDPLLRAEYGWPAIFEVK
jgi:cell wall assembly regulator SMI1